MKKIILFTLLIITNVFSNSSHLVNGQKALSNGYYSQAITWFKKAADLHNDTGMYFVGYMHKVGAGVDQDYKKAFKWYDRAANIGNAKAMLDLGLLYAQGKGVVKDTKKAKYWINKSVEYGNKQAKIIWTKYELWKY